MKRIYRWGFISLLGGLAACHSFKSPTDQPKDTVKSGEIRISVDESFRPVMEEELKVFKSSNPQANIIVSYKPEASCLKDFQSDSTRMIFVTRGLTKDEDDYYRSKLQYYAGFEVLAYDAVAVIVNAASPDSVFTPGQISQILQGKFSKPYTAVFDGLNATSTVRFALDSILRGEPFATQKVFAAENSTGVINYVASHPDAVGFVGVDWIGNPEDSIQDGYRKKVKIVSLQCGECPGKPFIQPYQQEILTNRYPFTRGLYYIIKENYQGLGTGLVDFLKYERGQLIFRRAYLVPAILPFIVRNAKIQ